MRILIAEDEVGIAKALKIMLERSKYSVDIVHTGTDAVDYAMASDYDGIVLDIMMPGMDGLEVLAKLREAGIAAPVLFLTAKGDIEDRVAGLNAGADDYLPKPFATSEFIARVKALTRRSGAYAPVILSLGETALDCNQYTLAYGGKSVRLNNKEYQMMELFMRHPHHVFSSERLMDKIWGLDSEAEIDVVWTYIGFLRRKLKQLGSDIEIRTVRGAGYSLEELKC
ncbi:MAG: response regulator transcription factor [Oscillospiraceae bacterium]|nr:response regulator transcription factor [Oscillospiraceae bacterium]